VIIFKKKNKKANDDLEFIKKRSIKYPSRGWGRILLSSAAVRYQLEYPASLGHRTETTGESPEKK